jgi:hypothetical protein
MLAKRDEFGSDPRCLRSATRDHGRLGNSEIRLGVHRKCVRISITPERSECGITVARNAPGALANTAERVPSGTRAAVTSRRQLIQQASHRHPVARNQKSASSMTK